MEETAGGLRERKKQATRSSLAAAALALGLERGVEHVTVEEIAARAGVSPRTFFNYFTSKEQAFLADDVDRAQRVVAALRAMPRDRSPWQALTGAVLQVVGADDVSTHDLAAREQLMRDSPAVLAEQLSQYAALEVELVGELSERTGAAPGDLLPHLLAAAVTAAVRAAAQAWAAGERSGVTFLDLLEEAVGHLAPAFAAPHS